MRRGFNGEAAPRPEKPGGPVPVEQLATAVDDDPRYSGIAHLRANTRFYDAVIDEIRGRRIRIGEHWLTDWASCNYLGFDLEPQIIGAVEDQLRSWGTHPSWSRMLGKPRLYPVIVEL